MVSNLESRAVSNLGSKAVSNLGSRVVSNLGSRAVSNLGSWCGKFCRPLGLWSAEKNLEYFAK